MGSSCQTVLKQSEGDGDIDVNMEIRAEDERTGQHIKTILGFLFLAGLHTYAHLVEWIADVINVFDLHVRQSSAVFSVHYVLVRRERKGAVRIGGQL